MVAKKSRLLRMDVERDSLHRQLGGGIPIGTTMILSGKFGTGKSAISERLTYGFLRHGHTVTFITTELTTKGFIDQMDSLDYSIRDDMMDERLAIIPVFPLIGKPISREDFLERLMNSPQLYKSDVIVIDAFSSLVRGDIDEERALQTLSFFKKLSGRSKTVVLTIDPDELRSEVLSPFKMVSDSLLELESTVVEGTVERVMYVKRFSKSAGKVMDAIGFRIEAGAGFIVDITLVA
jgi:flagellar protein FlaH